MFRKEGGPGGFIPPGSYEKRIYIKKVIALCLILTIQENCEEIVVKT